MVPDLTLCENDLCPAHARCYRFLSAAWANLENQSFAAYAPDHGADKCEHFIAADPCDQPRVR